jgi:hypothetical protein
MHVNGLMYDENKIYHKPASMNSLSVGNYKILNTFVN